MIAVRLQQQTCRVQSVYDKHCATHGETRTIRATSQTENDEELLETANFRRCTTQCERIRNCSNRHGSGRASRHTGAHAQAEAQPRGMHVNARLSVDHTNANGVAGRSTAASTRAPVRPSF
eukprot:3193130-Pleurochrysis_carterae.AAC.1